MFCSCLLMWGLQTSEEQLSQSLAIPGVNSFLYETICTLKYFTASLIPFHKLLFISLSIVTATLPVRQLTEITFSLALELSL